jgi:hypothetical protein
MFIRADMLLADAFAVDERKFDALLLWRQVGVVERKRVR